MSKYFSDSEIRCRCGECTLNVGAPILAAADSIREGWGVLHPEEPRLRCVSGARCSNYNTYLRMHGIPAAKHSAHMEGIAMDLAPVNGKIKEFHAYVESRLEELKLRMEDPIDAPSWAHVDTRLVGKSQKRVFRAGV